MGTSRYCAALAVAGGLLFASAIGAPAQVAVSGVNRAYETANQQPDSHVDITMVVLNNDVPPYLPSASQSDQDQRDVDATTTDACIEFGNVGPQMIKHVQVTFSYVSGSGKAISVDALDMSRIIPVGGTYSGCRTARAAFSNNGKPWFATGVVGLVGTVTKVDFADGTSWHAR